MARIPNQLTCIRNTRDEPAVNNKRYCHLGLLGVAYQGDVNKLHLGGSNLF